jgi:hypothetical protein
MRTSLPGLLVRGMLAVAVCAMGAGRPVRAEDQKTPEPKAQTPQTQTPAERLHAEVRRILVEAKSSEYQHKTSIDESTGKFVCDCSGLIDYALKRVAPANLKAIENHNPDKRPLAWDYVQTFQQASADAKNTKGPWLRIDRVADARPGDVLAWQNPKKVEGDGQSTGHVMMIDETPELVERKPDDNGGGASAVRDGGRLYRVRIIDSTKSGHLDDTRKPGQTGVGRGTIWIVTDENDKAVGYHWKSNTGKPREPTIAMGRAIAK